MRERERERVCVREREKEREGGKYGGKSRKRNNCLRLEGKKK